MKREKESEKDSDKEKTSQTTWYHEGSDELRLARYWIACYSIPRASERVVKGEVEETSNS